MTFAPSSKDRLTAYDLGRFPGETLFDRVARAVCSAGCLPRKELYEAWEVARRARRRFRGGRVIDVGGGHGLLGQLMLLLDGASPAAVVLDPAVPPSAARIHEALVARWPRLAACVTFLPARLEPGYLGPRDVVVSCHACGALTDRVLDAAVAAQSRVAVLPCCHDEDTCDAGALTGWMDPALAIDVCRAERLQREGYVVWTQTIPAAITPKNRLLLAKPRDPAASQEEHRRQDEEEEEPHRVGDERQ